MTPCRGVVKWWEGEMLKIIEGSFFRKIDEGGCLFMDL